MEHYSDYLQPQPGYKPVMTKEEIDKSPDNWLNFYPHKTFIEILSILLGQFESGDRSLWMYGAYGTGKSHAALVIQKLFNNDDTSVEAFIDRYKNCINKTVADHLRKWRSRKVLAVYEYGTDTVYTPGQFIMHIERAIQLACNQAGYKVPALSSSQQIMDRIAYDERRFFAKRDEIQDQLQYLNPTIDTYAKFEAACTKGAGALYDGLLSEAEKVLEHDHIYLNQNANELLGWIKKICDENGLAKIVFLWDEFSNYIDHAKGDLKTFEQMGESYAQQCNFHFVPITHMAMSAFLAEGAESAKKAKNRFAFKALEIPTDQVFQLGAHAFKINNEKEWNIARDKLWSDVSSLVNNYVRPHMPQGEEVSDEAFKGILPLHPMSAFLLMNLSGKVGANQRSFFDYLCKQDSESEFQRFLHEGGPAIANHQFLMVDYLWHYFIENDELSQDRAVIDIKGEYTSKSNALKLVKGSPEERVYKATLLYSLMEKMGGNGTLELLLPTVENIENSFRGDGAVVNVKQIMTDLEDRHCFSITNGHVVPLMAGDKVDNTKYLKQFNELIASPCADILKNPTVQGGDSLRYEVKAYDGSTYKQSDFGKRGDFGETISGSSIKQGNKILVNFLLAKDGQAKLEIPEKALQMARQFGGFRVVYAYFPNLSFCDKNKDQWTEYATRVAQEANASGEDLRSTLRKDREKTLHKWQDDLKSSSTVINLVIPGEKSGDEPYLMQNLTWQTFRKQLCEQKDKWFCFSPDKYSSYNMNAFKATPSGLKGWALAGLTGQRGGTYQGVLSSFERQGILPTEAWFASQPEHPLTKLRDLLDNKCKNAISSSGQVYLRRIYIELQRAPWGLEKNAYSAYVLGFVMKEWLNKNLQWSNGQISQPLDGESLAQIIEQVVADDGANLIKDERYICRLSSEEKAFIREITNIFDLTVEGGATPESVLNNLAAKISIRTDGIPLWVMPGYVKSLPTENAADLIGEVLDLLGEIMKISSKNKDTKKPEKIKHIGELFQKNDGLAAVIKQYITAEYFGKAFDYYLRQKSPELFDLVEKSKDQTLEYRKTILTKFAKEASWLWNEGDVGTVLADVVNQYKLIRYVQELLSIEGWIDFNAAQQKLIKVMAQDNRVSVDLLAMSYPFVHTIYAGANEYKIQGQNLETFVTFAEANKVEFATIFRDPDRTKIIEIIKKSLNDIADDIGADEWQEILAALPVDAAKLPEATFRQTLSGTIKEHRESSEGHKLERLWLEKTGSNNPEEWSRQNNLPADVLFASMEDGRAIVKAFQNGHNGSLEDVKAASNRLTNLPICSAIEQQSNFISRYLPKRYAKLNLSASDLAAFLKEHLGDNPNDWRENGNRENVVQDFVKQHYEADVLPAIQRAISGLSADEAKAKLIELLKKVPDAGIEMLGEC